MKKLKIIFWGTGPLAESTLYGLYKNGYVPEYVVTKPDSAVGRKQIMTPPMIKKWCDIKGIKVLQPESLKNLKNIENVTCQENEDKIHPLLQEYDLSIVASYGKIIPESVLNTPKYGFLNVHPSDLPKYRGPSPIESALLAGERELIISIMKLGAGMDSGPILIKQKLGMNMLDTAQSLELKAGQMGGELLSQIIPYYIDGSLTLTPQNNDEATICKFIEKSQGEIKLSNDIEEIKNKWRAFYPWPGIFFFINHKVHNEEKILRIKISAFDLLAENIGTCILKVIPEGKSEMSFEDFKRGYNFL